MRSASPDMTEAVIIDPAAIIIDPAINSGVVDPIQ
jgi:hypothetical protein